jgi:phosphoglycolate phosphatase
MNVLLFDIDGTLIDAGGAGQAAMEASLAEEFGATRPVTGISTPGRTDRAIAMDLFDFHGIDVNDAHWSRYLKSYFRLLPGALQTHEGVILPGVRGLLERLNRRDDVQLGLLTGNFAEGAKLKLAHYGLGHHFPFGGFGDEYLDRDDVARDAFRTVQARHPGVGPDRVWVIGDTPSDIRCGRAIGAKVVAVATGMFSPDELEPHRPDILLNDLDQAESWLQSAGLS